VRCCTHSASPALTASLKRYDSAHEVDDSDHKHHVGLVWGAHRERGSKGWGQGASRALLYSLDRSHAGGQLGDRGTVFSSRAFLHTAMRAVIGFNGRVPLSLDGTYKLEYGKGVMMVLSTHTVCLHATTLVSLGIRMFHLSLRGA
jgi:hypothetical protein